MTATRYVARRTWLDRLLHPGREFDPFTRQYVRAGWVAERQAIMDGEQAKHAAGVTSPGKCLDCRLPIDEHPMPERMWRSGPDLCAAARARRTQNEGWPWKQCSRCGEVIFAEIIHVPGPEDPHAVLPGGWPVHRCGG